MPHLFITGGYSASDGAGVYMQYGAVRNCTFSNNTTVGSGGGLCFAGATGIVQSCTFVANKAYNGGGGMYFTGSTTLVDQCRFLTNIARVGGGFCAGGSNLIVTNCEFIGNVATNRTDPAAGEGHAGGGVYSFCQGKFTHCSIISNMAPNGMGGGISLTAGLFTNCFISNNVALAGGGGISGGSSSGIRNCVIARNRITTFVQMDCSGGGVLINSGVMQNCLVEGNRNDINANNTAGGGVAIYGGTLRNCLIRDNVAYWGAGIYSRFGTVSCCTIVSNYARSNPGGGGLYGNASYTYGGTFFDNCLIYSNKNPSASPSSDNYLIINSSNFNFYVFSNCCVTPAIVNSGRTYATNTVTADPRFVDGSVANYRLTRDSPCVNAGVNFAWMAGTYDLDGYSRMDKFGGRVDIGCFERTPAGIMITIP